MKNEIKKISDRLYYTDYKKLDYEKATEYFLHRYNPTVGACSAVRKGNLFGRNYDWFYNDNVSFVVGRRAFDGKIGNICVTGALITKAMIDDGSYKNYMDYLPFYALDGINEYGVVCNINVLPKADKKGHTTGTKVGGIDVPILTLVRRILDEATSADDAIYKVQNVYNIIAPTSEDLSYEFHFMVADAAKTYVIEFVNNTPVVISDFVNDKPIMTNFYLYGFNIVNGVKTGLTNHANGIERYDIISNEYDSVNSVEDMVGLMKKVRYTNMYKSSTSPFWYSEYYDDYGGGVDITINTPTDNPALVEAINTAKTQYETRDRATALTWQTVHSSVYEINERALHLLVQEQDEEYVYTLKFVLGGFIMIRQRIDFFLAKIAGKIDEIAGITPPKPATTQEEMLEAISDRLDDMGELPVASASKLGGVKIGDGIDIDSDGKISAQHLPVIDLADIEYNNSKDDYFVNGNELPTYFLSKNKYDTTIGSDRYTIPAGSLFQHTRNLNYMGGGIMTMNADNGSSYPIMAHKNAFNQDEFVFENAYKKATNIPEVTGSNPTAAEFNALLNALINAGLMFPSV